MKKATDMPRVPTGIPNLDLLLDGGLPTGSVTIVSGPPGSGKTVLAQQLTFHNASLKRRTLFFSTLSEPTAKSLRYLRQFSFFEPKQLGAGVFFVDLGVMLRGKGLAASTALIMEHLKKVKPAIVVIDSFKVFDDLASSPEDLRKFGYELAVNLMAWEVTALLLGEYSPADYEGNPFFSIVDGCVVLSQQESQGEQQRFLKIVKMRGTDHSRDEHPFLITSNGIQLFAPRAMLRRDAGPTAAQQARCRTHIVKLDELLGTGIPWGSSLLIGGVAGTGKTVLSLEFLYRGALAGEKGILFSFEETEDRLRAAAQGLGWDIGRQIDSGMIEIVFIPQPDITVESHILMIRERVERLKAKRVVIDSVSVLLHKVTSAQSSRERVFHLCTIVQNAGAVGFFATDIPYGSVQVSRFGVEETVVDGVIILSATEEGLERERYIEIYKLRNTAHLKGRHNLVIGEGGVSIFPRYGETDRELGAPPPLEAAPRLGSGIPGLDPLLGGGLLRRSVTLVSGSAGVGKTIMGLQFLLEGVKAGEPGLYVTLEEGPEQLLAGADSLGLPLRAAVTAGRIQILYVSREHIRAGQFLTVLADHLTALEADRVVLDAASKMQTEHVALEEFRHVLYKLTVRFKTLGITSFLTIETPSLSAAENATELGLSPVADNLLMLRYDRAGARLAPTLTIVKTRGSDHDRRTHELVVGAGGARVGGPLGGTIGGTLAGTKKAPRAKTPRGKSGKRR